MRRSGCLPPRLRELTGFRRVVVIELNDITLNSTKGFYAVAKPRIGGITRRRGGCGALRALGGWASLTAPDVGRWLLEFC